MKWLYVLVAMFMAVNAQNGVCYNSVVANCDRDVPDSLDNCNATFSGFQSSVTHLQAYVNDQIVKSFEYLLLSSNFGTYVKNRPGFAKQFKGLSDTAWGRSIDLIKHITKRGGEHNFEVAHTNVATQNPLELDEISAMSFALDTEKSLALTAHRLHEIYSHANHKARYDAEVAHYLEEKFVEEQASTVRKLSGHINDLKKLLHESVDPSLSLYLFDEYLQKQ